MPDHVVAAEGPALEPAACALAEPTTLPPSSADWASNQDAGEPESGDRARPDVEEKWAAISGGPKGSVAVRIVRPRGVDSPLPAVLYLHGAGRGADDTHAHDRLVRELAVGAHATVLFPEYTPAPKASYGVALEECGAVARWVANHGSGHGMDSARLAVAGDSGGGNMSAALTLLAKERGDISFVLQVLLYPLSHWGAAPSRPLAEERIVPRRFRSQCTTDEAQHAEACDLLQATEQRLSGLPPALVVTAETDGAQDAGQAYAAKLRSAGVGVSAVHYGSSVDDLVLTGTLPSARPARGAAVEIIDALNRAFDR
ncbi:alpha/beta hydrolase [Streptomyces sp. NPDC058964]|uniref:alpha/beta hydrolase n=1 Tax=Streptomyces sp. NPDC058964 TaxID=3346681 RepID=UPI0036C6A12A